MTEIKYIDLRIFYYPGVQLDFLGSGQLEHKDIIELALQLQETIKNSKLDQQTKDTLMQLSIGDFISTVKNIAEKFVDVREQTSPVPTWSLSPLLDPQRDPDVIKQTLDTYKNTGQCKCPRCGFKLISVDGEVRCINCGFNCGIIEQ